MAGPNYQTRAERQISFRPSADSLADSRLNRRAKESPVGTIDPSVHEALGVGWRDDGVVRDGQEVTA